MQTGIPPYYAVPIEPGETIWTGDGRKFSVLDVVSTQDDYTA
jgi:hypothetical protein